MLSLLIPSLESFVTQRPVALYLTANIPLNEPHD